MSSAILPPLGTVSELLETSPILGLVTVDVESTSALTIVAADSTPNPIVAKVIAKVTNCSPCLYILKFFSRQNFSLKTDF